MPAGLECYDDNGIATVSITDRITKILGTVSTNLSNGSINVPELSNGRPWVRAITLTNGSTNEIGAKATVSGTTVSWSYPSGFNSPPNSILRNTKIFYGIY